MVIHFHNKNHQDDATIKNREDYYVTRFLARQIEVTTIVSMLYTVSVYLPRIREDYKISSSTFVNSFSFRMLLLRTSGELMKMDFK